LNWLKYHFRHYAIFHALPVTAETQLRHVYILLLQKQKIKVPLTRTGNSVRRLPQAQIASTGSVGGCPGLNTLLVHYDNLKNEFHIIYRHGVAQSPLCELNGFQATEQPMYTALLCNM
jgi:hypothetical protein